MDLKKLRILLAVARTGSFTGAAERVKLTQSAVSQQMALLEQDMREPLFERGRRGVKLTPFALQLCERAEPLVIEMENLGAAFRRRSEREKVIRVGAFPTAGIELLPKAIRLFRKSNPNVQVMMSNINLESPETSLDTREVDLILSFDYGLALRDVHPSLRRIELFEDPLLAILPACHPLVGSQTVDLIDLAGECWIFHRHANYNRNIYPLICSRAGFTPEVVFYVDDFYTLQGLIAEEIGVSIAPRLSVIHPRDDVSIIPIAPPVSRRISVLTRAKASESDFVDEFVAALQETSKAMPSASPNRRVAKKSKNRPGMPQNRANDLLRASVAQSVSSGLGIPDQVEGDEGKSGRLTYVAAFAEAAGAPKCRGKSES